MVINEIEQLKRDNEVLYRDNVALSETADRLRDALERIANNHWTSSTAESMRSIARAALELEESK